MAVVQRYKWDGRGTGQDAGYLPAASLVMANLPRIVAEHLRA